MLWDLLSSMFLGSFQSIVIGKGIEVILRSSFLAFWRINLVI